ncbi:maltase 2-like [Hermetia illucens]|uniref:maltase 2-like n=1 Tax=Hermetia illucens TaxID=343691 RepID=UPI0018CC590B|nr:maltase 2-like [Hermetia illucens]
MKLLLLLSALWVSPIFSQSDWWQTGQFYQIYPRSFKDSNGDGIGDLNGIREKLPHLKDIGMTAAWLSPIYKSPMKDFGYDISDFKAIQPEYGTMADFEALLKRAKELGIKLIMDLVPNHTSDLHEWFQKSVNRVKGYEDFYIWHDGYPDPKNSSNRLPPNNWSLDSDIRIIIGGFRDYKSDELSELIPIAVAYFRS